MKVDELLDKEKIYYQHSGQDYVINCLNPEHPDNNPSMRIDKLTGIFNCLSCGFSGNLFKHFDVTVNMMDIDILKIKSKISRIKDNNKFIIPLGAEVFDRPYRNIKGETYKQFGTFTHPDYEGRLCFPIYDISNNLVGVSARYVNSGDVPDKYSNHPKGVSFPLYPTRPNIINGAIIIVEGIFDVLNLYDKGILNVVATLGISGGMAKRREAKERFRNKMAILRLQGVSKLFIMYDDGVGGNKAAEGMQRLLSDMFIVKVITLKGGKDPGELDQQEVDNIKELINA